MIKLTIEVTPKQLAEISQMLLKDSKPNVPINVSSSPSKAPEENPQAIKSLFKESIKNKQAQKPKMPSFGRTKEQLKEYEEQEKERIQKLVLKQREKDTKEEEKAIVTAIQEKEVKAILEESKKTTTPVAVNKPWEL